MGVMASIYSMPTMMDCLFNERVENRRHWIPFGTSHHLRVPLNSQYPAAIPAVVLQPFDNPIRRYRVDAQTGSNAVHGLMVEAVDLQFSCVGKQARQCGSRGQTDGMARWLVGIAVGMLDTDCVGRQWRQRHILP